MGGVPFASYDDALDFLSAFTNYEKRVPGRATGPKLGLERVFELLASVGDPQRDLRCVHVAGTKGKGSTGAMIERILRRSGAKVGVYSSPHVMSERERIQIDGTWISEDQAVALISRMHTYLAKAMSSGESYRPSFFEIFTAMAFLHFQQESTDWAVIEVGLGGRLDATSVVNPRICVITPVSFDHMNLLGDTLDLIAVEKAGILKPGVPVVVSRQEPEALDVILARARELDAPVRRTGEDVVLEPGPDGTFSVRTWRHRYDRLRCSMIGRHQQENAATAVGAIEAINDLGEAEVGEDAIRDGLADAVLMGRIEILSQRPAVVVDVAHNVASVRALLEAIDEKLPHNRMIVVFGCAIDKPAAEMLKLLAPRADRLIVTRIDSPRAAQPDDLAQIAAKAGCTNVSVVAEIKGAVSEAIDSAAADDLVCVTGSFYLAGDARRFFVPSLTTEDGRA